MLVKVIKIPAGSAPELVRQQWVGAILETAGGPHGGFEEHFDGSSVSPRLKYSVPVGLALDTLEQISPGAADWFREHISPGVDALTFGADEVQPIVNEGM